MKKVLIVAYMFPPIGGIGVVRAVQFAKYLPQFGWEPVILTVAKNAEYMVDASLLQELPASVKIYRAHSWEPLNSARIKRAASRLEAAPTAKNKGSGEQSDIQTQQPALRQRVRNLLKSLYFSLRIPDDKVGWYPFAVRLGKGIMRTEGIDLIFATAPPYTNFLVGSALKSAGGKPLVLDYRDEWTTMRYRDFPATPMTQAINQRLERGVVANADAVVTAIAPFADNLRAAGLLREKTPLVNLMNGFDPEHYQHHEPDHQPYTPNPRFTIVYTGTFYGNRQTPAYFLQGLHCLLTRRPALRSQIEVRFIGTIVEQHARLIDELGLADVVRCCGAVPHGEAVAAQMAADVLLLVVGKGTGSGVVLTGKVFEYLGAGRPILALAPLDGPAAALIRETQTGVVIDAEDVATISQTLEELYTQWHEGQLMYAPNQSALAQYNRCTQTGHLAAMFNQIVHVG